MVLKKPITCLSRTSPNSTPPFKSLLSVNPIVIPLSTEVVSTFAGLPKPKSISYTPNLVDPATPIP
ncbi:hypothetical protein MtrunA17_Chr7g0219131 [Medicago truncatula]|uniref:Uncharacterized protein n=1 Tax=Medicago truncatula TaxID=3880 RepID=A0A396GVE5_MEDTR|nr:hypothetical protein MtrunA17_Chr7g0219131 [Medicago truncatula]